MDSETSRGASIPTASVAVKKVLIGELSGHGVRVHDVGMDVSREATASEIMAAMSALRSVQDQTKFHVCFCLGDAYSQARRRSDIGDRWPGIVRKRFGVKTFNELRGYAWVAEKWPKGERDPTKSWNFHKNHSPQSGGVLKRPKPPVSLRITDRRVVDGEEVVYLTDDFGRQYIGRAIAEGLVNEHTGGTEGDRSPHDPSVRPSQSWPRV